MGEDIEITVIHGADYALGLFLAGKIEFIMDGAYGVVELFQDAIIQVKFSIIEDIDLHPF